SAPPKRQSEASAEPTAPTGAKTASGEWMPIEPETLPAAGLTDSEVEALVLKTLNGRAEATGRALSDHLKLAFRVIDPLMQSMKQDRLGADQKTTPRQADTLTLT